MPLPTRTEIPMILLSSSVAPDGAQPHTLENYVPAAGRARPNDGGACPLFGPGYQELVQDPEKTSDRNVAGGKCPEPNATILSA